MSTRILSVCVVAALAASFQAKAGVVQEQQAQIDDLIERVEDLEAANNTLQALLAGVYRWNDTLVFSGMNVQIVNGLGETDGVDDGNKSSDEPVVNGLGNLVIGYNEQRDVNSDKSGSHNLVVGVGANYASYGGVVAGFNNGSGAPFAVAIGGGGNHANEWRSSVLGGLNNIADSLYATAVGGESNDATGFFSLVAGGYANAASNGSAAVFGGRFNLASQGESTVVGGQYNVASGGQSTVSGGAYNTASAQNSSVSGGRENSANGASSVVSGGYQRTVDSQYDWRAGDLFEED